MKNKMRETMLRKSKAVGTFFEIGSSNAVECLGLAGLDFLIIDTEHGIFDVESATHFVRAARVSGITPAVRVKDGSRPSILKMLDIGVQVIIVPDIKTAEEAKKLVEYGKYFPLGQRGFAYGRDAGWGSADYAENLEQYFETCNRETLIIPQCENVDCVKNIDEITSIEGIDGVFIGPYDLSISFGRPAEFEHPEFKAAINKVIESCKRNNKFCMIYAPDTETGRKYFEQGLNAVAVGMDTVYYIETFKNMIGEVKSEKFV